MAKKLTDEQKRRNRIIHNVTSKKNYLDKEDRRSTKDLFLEKFILCEIPTRLILTYYFSQNGEAKEVDSVEMAYTTIIAALKKSGYNPDEDMLKKVFKAKEKRGEKSARDLRNGIVHDLNIYDLMEVMDRKNELFKLLDDYYEFRIQPV